ncbi:MAG: polysaccharide deacetylase family protein [Magnetococcales bacterium]|nr:polysaccharide deacetylase family protein [Magnetococcales bacterium]
MKTYFSFSVALCLVLGSVFGAWEAYGNSSTTRSRAYRNETPATASYLLPGGDMSMSWAWLTLPEERIMALTFDDGPVERDLEIAALLKSMDVAGTFFFIGQKVEANPDIVKKIAATNNEIGYHSYRHQKLSWISPGDLKDDFRQGKAAFAKMGVSLTWFRPPYGLFNGKVVKTAKDNGMETILWTIDPKDWTGIGPEQIAERVEHQFHPGAVLLFHSNHAATLHALPAIIESAKSKGYHLVALGDWKRTVQAAHCRKDKRFCPSVPPTIVADTTSAETLTKAESTDAPIPDKPSFKGVSIEPNPTDQVAAVINANNLEPVGTVVVVEPAENFVKMAGNKRGRHRTPMPIVMPAASQLTRSATLPIL